MIDSGIESFKELESVAQIAVKSFLERPDREKANEILKLLAQFVDNFNEQRKNSLKLKKAQERGGFDKRVILDYINGGQEGREVYSKLVRDKIPERLIGLGLAPVAHIAEGKDYVKALKEKLLEEFDEFLKNPCEEEVADVEEVMEALIKIESV